MHFPSARWHLVAGTLSICLAVVCCAPVSQENGGQYDIFVKPQLLEGDIAGVLPTGKPFSSIADEQQFLARAARNGIIKNRWQEGKLPYEISPLFNTAERNVVLGAIAEINEKAEHLQLIERTEEENYVFITRGAPDTGCWSYVGNLHAGIQILNLQAPVGLISGHCIHHGTVVHELNHAVGFYHEQSRTDRDEHVEINWDNIEKDKQHNFAKYDETFVTDFGLPYDINSLMHYQRGAFAINRTIWTIRPKAPNHDLPTGQSKGLSDTDILKLNAMYN